MYHEDERKKKRLALIGVSAFLLLAIVAAVTVGVGLKAGSNNGGVKQTTTQGVSTSVKAIKAICQPTDYRETCEQTLEKAEIHTTDPKELIKAAIQIAEQYVSAAANKSSLLQELEKDSRTRNALAGCRELMGMAVSEFRQSVEKVNDFNVVKFDEVIADLQTWLSATITYQETCLDGFENTTTSAGEKMKQVLKTAMELSSNSLDIVTGFSSVLSSLHIQGGNRRLLEHELPVLGHGDAYPSWVEMGARKLLSVAHSDDVKPDIVVAKDGSGDYRTIREAIDSIPKKRNESTVLYIREGIYDEHVEIPKSAANLVVIGDGSNRTRITGSKNFVDGIPTYHTATLAVVADNFTAKNIGIENSAGAIKHQAVALRVSGDFAVFHGCAMDGFQDTLYTHTKRQFYRDCTISGTIDFVFGDAAAVFQNCTFLVRKPLENQQCIVTAQGRKQRRQPSAIIIQNSTIAAHPELYPERTRVRSYLGRPWKEYSRTIIMETFIDDLINPDGWLPWLGTFGLSTCWYTEFNNYGPGSDLKARVTWKGIKNITRQHAMDFTPGRFLRGNTWIKTRVPYTPYLTRA